MASKTPSNNSSSSEVCYECRGITYKLGKSSPECFGWKSKSVRVSESIPYDLARDALPQSGKYVAIGRTVTTAKLEKENIPPVPISMGWFPSIAFVLQYHDPNSPDATEAPPVDPLLAPKGKSSTSSSSSSSVDIAKLPSQTATEVGAGKGGQIKRPPARPKQSFEDIMRKGATIQYESLVRTYGEVTDNFPGRARSAAVMIGKGMQITAQTIGSQLHRLLFDRDGKK